MRSQSELFECKPTGDWKPDPNLPDLTNFRSLSLDTEYDLKGRQQILAGISIKTPDGQKRYLPVNHGGGGNLDPEQVRRWAKNELRGKRIVGLNIGNDAEVVRAWGVDLESQGNTIHDIAHAASLLNEYRISGFGLDALGNEYAKRRKMDCPIDKDKIAASHSSMIGPYAEEDAALAFDVDEIQQPLIHREDLGRVQDLEDRLIWANNHIERNGARMDLEKLHLWRSEVRAEYSNALMAVYVLKPLAAPMGFSPNKSKSWSKLFENLGFNKHFDEETGKESYPGDFLNTIKDPTVMAGLKAKRLASLLSKYLDKFAEGRSKRSKLKFMTGDILHFTLHQLRSKNDDEDDLDGADGTVSGRYSSADVNIQQIMKVDKQIKFFGSDDHILRELFIPDEGFDYFSGDASQIEFRLFTHYSRDRDLIQAYGDDKETDFYLAVAALTGQSRDDAKITSLGTLYGMGISELAGWLNLKCNCGVGLKCHDCDLPNHFWEHSEGCGRLVDSHDPNCPAVKAMLIYSTYNEKFPAAQRLARQASKIAKRSGYVTTLLGRRQRFGDRWEDMMHKLRKFASHHSALNRIIQGSAADIFKMKLLMLYENRNTIGIHKLRQPVHDEATGDIERSEQARKRLQEAFDEVTIPLRVPLLWDLGFGKNWKEAHG